MIPCHSTPPPCKMLLKGALKPVRECCFQFAETARALSLWECTFALINFALGLLHFADIARSPSLSPALRVYLCFNKLCFVLKLNMVVCNSLLTILEPIAGEGLPLTSSVEAVLLQRHVHPDKTKQNHNTCLSVLKESKKLKQSEI